MRRPNGGEIMRRLLAWLRGADDGRWRADRDPLSCRIGCEACGPPREVRVEPAADDAAIPLR
jgi:hypothetical protein